MKFICDKVTVGLLRKEPTEARALLAAGLVRESNVAAIHARYTYRMHDLSEFMTGLMRRFTQWFNGRHQRSGTLWERAREGLVGAWMSHEGWEADAKHWEGRRLESGGRVSPAKRLRWRLRCFSDGVVIGSRSFVDAFLRVIADGSGRGARAVRGTRVVTLRH